jgi:hypothetical protein
MVATAQLRYSGVGAAIEYAVTALQVNSFISPKLLQCVSPIFPCFSSLFYQGFLSVTRNKLNSIGTKYPGHWTQ